MGKKYKNPPIIEAVCEFRVSPDTEWDVTIPGLIYEKLQGKFPKKQKAFKGKAQISKGEKGTEYLIGHEERIAFLADDEKRLVLVGPSTMSVSCFAPYPTWDGFKPYIEEAFSTLTEKVDVKGLQRIGLRYINKIEIPNERIALEDYFEFYPFLGKNLPQDLGSFIVGGIFPLAEERDMCRLHLTTAVPEKPDSLAFILDLDYYLAKPQAVHVNESLNWIENAHQKIGKIFEGCINDRLRAIFQGDE